MKNKERKVLWLILVLVVIVSALSVLEMLGIINFLPSRVTDMIVIRSGENVKDYRLSNCIFFKKDLDRGDILSMKNDMNFFTVIFKIYDLPERVGEYGNFREDLIVNVDKNSFLWGTRILKDDQGGLYFLASFKNKTEIDSECFFTLENSSFWDFKFKIVGKFPGMEHLQYISDKKLKGLRGQSFFIFFPKNL